jgi:hypothetical protein
MTKLSFLPNTVVGTSNFTTKIIIPKKFSMKPLFTSNIFYNLHSASSGVGTVRNINRINKKT